ncbi:hypothetical protein HC891_06310 [Candidatus Gracilibacteria bacterium]|nr:hypothetical protein [Candidatus Gracilibacteria bacterium]
MRPKGGDKYAVYDTLVEQLCWERLEPAAFIYTKGNAESVDGFYTLQGPPGEHGLFDRKQLRRRKVEQRALTRVAINRRRGTAENTRLYSPLVLDEYSDYSDPADSAVKRTPTRFLGQVWLPDDSAITLKDLEGIDGLGGRQSSGLGRVTVNVSAQQPEGATPIRQRISALSERMHAGAAFMRSFAGECTAWYAPDTCFFTVNLLADAILLEQGWLPTYHSMRRCCATRPASRLNGFALIRHRRRSAASMGAGSSRSRRALASASAACLCLPPPRCARPTTLHWHSSNYAASASAARRATARFVSARNSICSRAAPPRRPTND